MARPLLDRGELPRSHHHVAALIPHQGNGLGKDFGAVGVIPVDHHVDVRLHIAEQPAHRIALAAALLVHHLRPRGPGLGSGVIAAGVVADHDPRLGQLPAQRGHHPADGSCLVVAGDQNGNLQRRGCAQVGATLGEAFGEASAEHEALLQAEGDHRQHRHQQQGRQVAVDPLAAEQPDPAPVHPPHQG